MHQSGLGDWEYPEDISSQIPHPRDRYLLLAEVKQQSKKVFMYVQNQVFEWESPSVVKAHKMKITVIPADHLLFIPRAKHVW